ncbi:MAG: hypothetical protein J2P17_06920 [Mycobacterium sp.]|nr:hypothetical protein [Mycobacterium sp.]
MPDAPFTKATACPHRNRTQHTGRGRVIWLDIWSDPDEDRDADADLAATSPTELSRDVRAAVGRVYACAQAWRSSPSWRGDKFERWAYECVVIAAAEVAALPDRSVDHLVQVVTPILSAWWPAASGQRQDIHEAVEELRRIAMHRAV